MFCCEPLRSLLLFTAATRKKKTRHFPNPQATSKFYRLGWGLIQRDVSEKFLHTNWWKRIGVQILWWKFKQLNFHQNFNKVLCKNWPHPTLNNPDWTYEKRLQMHCFDRLCIGFTFGGVITFPKYLHGQDEKANSYYPTGRSSMKYPQSIWLMYWFRTQRFSKHLFAQQRACLDLKIWSISHFDSKPPGWLILRFSQPLPRLPKEISVLADAAFTETTSRKGDVSNKLSGSSLFHVQPVLSV